MNNKLISLAGIFFLLLVGIAGANLVFSPSTIDFGTVEQNVAKSLTITISNPDPSTKEDITLSAGTFSYANQFIGTSSFDGQVTFDSNNFNLTPNQSKSVVTTLNVPLTAKMGEYTSNFVTTYTEDGTSKTQNIIAKVLVSQFTGRVGDLKIVENSFDNIPDQAKTGRSLDIELEVKNMGSDNLDNIKVASWIYDEDINQVVAFKESSSNTINAGDEELFTLTLSIDDALNSNHDFTLYVKAYDSDDEINNREVKSKDINIIGEGDLCDIGDLDITDINLDDDKFEPGDTIEVEVDVENNGFEDIDDVVVEVWISEEGKTKKIEKDKSDEFDLDEDSSETVTLELKLDDDIDDGDYEIHARVFEKGNDDVNCFEEIETVEIERPDHKVIIEGITITSLSLTCGDTFSADVDVQNVGNKDDNAVKVRMQNADLNIDEISETFQLDEFDDPDDHKTVFLNGKIPDDADDKEYTLTFTLYYDDLDQQKNYVEKITVSNCGETTGTNEEEQETDTTTGTNTNTEGSRTVFIPTGSAIADFLESETAKTVFWIVADVALLIIAIYFIVALFRRRK